MFGLYALYMEPRITNITLSIVKYWNLQFYTLYKTKKIRSTRESTVQKTKKIRSTRESTVQKKQNKEDQQGRAPLKKQRSTRESTVKKTENKINKGEHRSKKFFTCGAYNSSVVAGTGSNEVSSGSVVANSNISFQKEKSKL